MTVRALIITNVHSARRLYHCTVSNVPEASAGNKSVPSYSVVRV